MKQPYPLFVKTIYSSNVPWKSYSSMDNFGASELVKEVLLMLSDLGINILAPSDKFAWRLFHNVRLDYFIFFCSRKGYDGLRS